MIRTFGNGRAAPNQNRKQAMKIMFVIPGITAAAVAVRLAVPYVSHRFGLGIEVGDMW